MTFAELAKELDIRQIVLKLEAQGRISYTAPSGALTPDLIGTMREHKAELIAALASEPLAEMPQDEVTEADSAEPQAEPQVPPQSQRDWMLFYRLKERLEAGTWPIKTADVLLEHCYRAQAGDMEAWSAITAYLDEPAVIQALEAALPKRCPF